MKKLLGIVVLGLFFITNSNSKEILPANLIDHIDICSFGSSLGPTCKETNFDPNKYFKSGKKTVKDNLVHYEFDDWDYYFEIIKKDKNEVIIKFEDNAKYATYLSTQLIKLKYNENKKKWITVSTKNLYPSSEADENFVLINNKVPEREFLIKFDGICVQNIDKIELVNAFAKSAKWVAIPPGEDAMVAPRVKGPAYKSYGFKEDQTVYLIAINDAENKNMCSMATSYNSIKNIKNVLNEFYQMKLLDKQSQGMQNLEIYAVRLLQSENEGMIILNFSAQEGYKYVTLSVMVDNE